jgi:magnesium chelatase family protein
MIGPPSTGETLLAKGLPTILPPLTPAECLETIWIFSAMGRPSFTSASAAPLTR